MKEITENSILNYIYESICNEFEEAYINEFGEPKEKNVLDEAEDELIDMILKSIKNEKTLETINEIFIKYQRYGLRLLCFWQREYFKYGLKYGINLYKEINLK